MGGTIREMYGGTIRDDVWGALLGMMYGGHY